MAQKRTENEICPHSLLPDIWSCLWLSTVVFSFASMNTSDPAESLFGAFNKLKAATKDEDKVTLAKSLGGLLKEATRML